MPSVNTGGIFVSTAHRSANLNIEPLFRNEPLRNQLKLMLLDGLISYAAKVHYLSKDKHRERTLGF
ncbi:hypothetical protein KKI95_18450 [Xenorhabdus bovienii]|uniref:hypothetical protein n=2 Tax=Xenorhabdus bovienii TaxID=40576 RepID=UPI0023B29060|nr:hypothetical protein [Xenorhabdus bovienii]MDE9437850.1 hypothetical protein [Xenorhabdus bovienii]MDE9456022.1 hypothetical protein [Xenorhabdus bovienii]MDE9483463.1 hypothetical protein [Xenorhabdus bovienii]MDE9553669.1 hypothetical protein [Xenorhabdus bovienii]MDE9557913.1 hypothetical protein [Xenorhabdus bovienii]